MTALLVGLVIGLVLGLTGAGGSLFAVPLLGLLLGLPLVQATGIALGAVAVSAMLGVIQRRGVGIVWLPVSIILVGGVVLAPLGRWLAGYVPVMVLLGGFSLLAVWVSSRLWRDAAEPSSTTEIRAEGAVDWSQTPPLLASNGFWPSPILVQAIVAGMATGVLSGLLGVGGGFVIVPILTLVVGLTMAQAVTSSLLVIACVSLSGFAAHWWLHPGLDTTLLAQTSLGGMLGMSLGGLLGRRLAGAVLQRVFAIMLLATVPLLWWI
ncbi:sulfite exporter TauE/SafE family protein [Pseudomaricurvus alkylphenolicus]|uniref:sulfite exporter TauE/SafE family protein n=1 Tax=Pseudomaricurvus alkylphenolicus TaxID=1306991 RepID=UPI00141E43B6|nr:sulfite exporter TauE/SafE family protein [Pseudomaricurvus alkylphenolicus]NIB39795.1 sulfite exporter TauE/SafE family protein [Pseudomaricurvus alkylphenolicus]